MNLWDKASKLALMIVLALFFVACKEELNNVGKNNIGDQFDLLFEEFTLPSQVIIDSIFTSRFNLLTGTYTDSEFGLVTSEAYTTFFGLTDIDLSGSDIVFDSLVLSLRLTPYYYGAKTETPITIQIHRLTEELTDLDGRTNLSSIMYDPTSLGQATFTLNPEKYDTLEVTEEDFKLTDSLRIKLDDTFFSEIQADIVSDTTAINVPLDFYGFAIVTSSSDKIVSISSTSTETNLALHYHTVEAGANADTLIYFYSFNQQGYNKITSDRSGTPIAGLSDDNPSTPITPENNMRYVQSGTGVTTELDFQPFLDFFADKEHMIINSVELSLGEIASTTDLSAPVGISLLNTDEEGELSPLDVNGASFFTVQTDANTQLFIPFVANDDTGVYSALPTQYFQFLYSSKVERSTSRILPTVVSNGTVVSESGFQVDRFVVHQDSIKLKVYYTLPK